MPATDRITDPGEAPGPRLYRSHESIAGLHQFAILHTLVTITLSYHLLFSQETSLSTEATRYLVLFLLAVTAIVWRVPARLFGSGWFVGTWVLGDTLLTTAVIFLSGQAGSDLYVTLFLIILLAAFAPSFKQTIALSALLCAGYGLILYIGSEEIAAFSTEHFLRIPLLLVMATFYGNSVEMLRKERTEKWALLLRQRQQAEEALRESEKRLHLIMNHAQDAIFYIERTGEIRWCNHQAEIVTGRSQSSLVGQSFFTVLSPQTVALAEEQLAASGRGESGPTLVELEVVRPDGASVWLELNTTSTEEGQDEARRLLVARDMTQRRQLEAQLRQAQKMEAVGRLAGGIAHDFNNLLQIINGYSQLLFRRLAPNDPSRSELDEIKKAGIRAAALTSQLLTFSRRQVIQPQVMSLNAAVTNLSGMLQRLIGEDIELVSLLDSLAGHVKVDPGQFDQIVINLVLNARDAMPQGGRLTIETANVELDAAFVRQHPTVRVGPYVMLAVSDTGLGMDKEMQAHVFEPFFTTKEQSKGTGLGLATVYGSVQQSAGHIFVSSEPGRGTTFKIYLPRIQAEVQAAGPPPSFVEPARGSETVLLVEDNPSVRTLVRDTLRLYGYTVLEAGHGLEALAISNQHGRPIHLLLTDVVMPQMGGRELAERLASLRPEMKVIYMSGYTDDAVVRHGVSKTEAAFLQKPFTPDTLASKVREVLDATR